MIDSTLKGLEWLAKYGFIDIIFGAGILTVIANAFKSKAVKNIDGIEIIPLNVLTGEAHDVTLQIEIRNLTHDPVYIFRSYFSPGYSMDMSSTTTIFKDLKKFMFMQWITSESPVVSSSEHRNSEGVYIITSQSSFEVEKHPPFLEYKESLNYFLRMQCTASELQAALNSRKTGQLELRLVHGNQTKILKTQV